MYVLEKKKNIEGQEEEKRIVKNDDVECAVGIRN
jgi:hypothetical protein